MATIHRMLDEGYRIEEVDAILGQPMGRPKLGGLPHRRPGGIDTLVHVADNLYENLPDDPQRELFRVPEFIRDMVARKWLGDKTGQGFYKRVKGADGKSEILAIDPATLEYRPQESVHFSSHRQRQGQSRRRRARALGGGRERPRGQARVGTDRRYTALLGGGGAGNRRRYRQHRQRDALGIQLGRRPLPDVGRAGRGGAGAAHDRRGAHAAAAGAKRCWATARALLHAGATRSYWDFTATAYQPVPAQRASVTIWRHSRRAARSSRRTVAPR